VQRISTRLHVRSSRALHDLHITEAHRRLGFSSFSDFSRERLGLAPSTVRDRLKLHEAISRSAGVAKAVARAEISESKAIALLPALKLNPADPVVEQWLNIAGDLSVRGLRCVVRESVRSMGSGEEGESDEDSDEGHLVSFCGPIPVVRMFDEAMETARKVLGTRAPRYRCVEALLAETSSAWQRLEPGLEERLEEDSAQPPGRRGAEGQGSDQAWIDSHSGRPRDLNRAAPGPSVHLTREPWHPPRSPESGESADRVRDRAVPASASPTILLRATRTVRRIEQELAEIEALISCDPATHGTADSPTPAQTDTIDLQTEIDRIAACERLDAPLRIYRAEILRDLRDTGAMASLGYDSWADFARNYLGMSERMARSLVAEGRLFDTEAGLRDAYGQGSLPLGKAFLLRRVVGAGRVVTGIDRAAAVTHRQLAREVSLIEWARQVGALLALGREAGEMEDSLMSALARWGWSRERVVGLLESAGITRRASGDPATDPGAMTRLERLIDLLILTIWDEPPVPDGDADDEALGDRRTSARANALMEVRFWAPDPVANDWRTAVGRIRERNGVGCPPWVAVSMIVADALQEWQRRDPKRIPTEERILLRDGYRCMVPVCSSMKNLEVHHIEFLSEGGSDEDWNKVTLCHGHHRMVHEGIVRVWGRAPHELYWEIGCQPDGPPLMRLKGSKILWTSYAR
jgi:hypothetical protein